MLKPAKTLLNIQNLVSPVEAANILGVTEGTLTIWRSTGRYNLPFVKVGRRVMYNAKDIEAFIEKRTTIHTGKEKNQCITSLLPLKLK